MPNKTTLKSQSNTHFSLFRKFDGERRIL